MKFWIQLSCLLAASSLAAREPAQPLVFERDVRPILKTHCFHCHGETDKPKAGLDLRLRRFMGGVGENGAILIPGKPRESILYQMMAAGEMPKGEKKLPLEDLKKIEQWIEQGTRTARPEPTELAHGFVITDEERNFWSFQPIKAQGLPRTMHPDRARATGPIDQFVLAELQKQKLRMAPEAPRATLVRRLYLDLWGLPPSPEDVQAFVEDKDPRAFEKVVDRLLASPRYGERWGRHWLDVAGYADSNGFAEADSKRPHAWRYRDYVIRSFNEDKPFDQFILEQLAGDELAGPRGETLRPEQVNLLAATGFLRMAPDGTGDEVPDANLAKNQVIADTIKIVSSSLLGLTVACAQCHDHRYDPISQADYFRMRAIFEPAFNWKAWRIPAARLVSLYTPEDRAKAQAVEVEAQKLDEANKKKYKELLDVVFEKELLKLPEAVRETTRVARNTSKDKRTAEQVALFKMYPAADVQFALDLYDPAANKIFLAELQKATALRATKPSEPFIMALTELPGPVPDTFIFNRGDHDQPKEKVAPGNLSVLQETGQDWEPSKSADLPTSGRRLAYAQMLTSGQHPLLARVFVNRIWLNHFGRGLVATPGDFGALGEKPTHPELLDYLAKDFMANGWNVKRLHKLMVMSATYQQASQNSTSLKQDPENRFYARMKIRRLDAETLRDGLLTVSGSLNLTQHGAPVPVALDTEGRIVTGQQVIDGNGLPSGAGNVGASENRRSIYVEVVRHQPLTVLETFDGPMMSPNCEIRSTTTVAPQSLMLMNDSFVLAQSDRLAQKVRRETGGDVFNQIEAAWKLIFGEAISADEMVKALRFISAQETHFRTEADKITDKAKAEKARGEATQKALASLCQVYFSSNRFLYE